MEKSVRGREGEYTKGENVVPSELRFLSSARYRSLQGNVGICTSKPENVRELKRDPISQAIECGDCHLSNGWRRAFYKRTVKCANRRSVPSLHFNQIISLLCASRLKGSRGTKGFNLSLLLLSRCNWAVFYSFFFVLFVLTSHDQPLMLFSEPPLSRRREMSRDISWLDCHFVPSLSLSPFLFFE